MTTEKQMADLDAASISRIRESEFPVIGKWKFFNHAACSPLPKRAALAMEKQIREHGLNGNLGNSGWSRNREDARTLVAKLLNCQREEVAFVGNTADGLSIAANGYKWREGDNVVTTNVEYPANMYPWLNLARRGVAVKTVPERDGRILLEDIVAAIDERTRILSISWVEFASGFRNDLVALGALCRERGVMFVVDAIQALGAFPIDVKAAHIDVLACGGQKWLLGPRGCGLVFCSKNALETLDVSVVGAYSVVDEHNYLDYKLEFKSGATRFEYGTENAVGIAGLHGSLELLLEVGVENIQNRILTLSDRFCEGARVKGYAIVGSSHPGERSGLTFFEKKDENSAEIAARLQEEGFVLSMRAGRLRFAPHFYNTEDEVDALIAAL
jgi:selenocysteine lyase/cysteine desulfurase